MPRYAASAYRHPWFAVTGTLADGTRLTETVKAVRGTAENPMTREEVIAKSRDLMTPILGAERCDKLIQTAMNLEKLKSVRELRPLLQRT